MGPLPGLDIDLLRTFTLIAEEGSFTRAAERVGRTQSAVSLQVQRLEALVEHRLFARGKGGVVQLTPIGRQLLERARELLALNDDILGSFRAPPKHGEVRIGLPEDYQASGIPQMLADFSEQHSEITVETFGAPSCALMPLLKSGDLDLMICEAGIEPRDWPSVVLWRRPLYWVVSSTHTPHLADPLPLSLSPGNCPWRPPWLHECLWRGAALRALERVGRRHRVVSTSANVAGQQTAVLAGLAVMVSTLPDLTVGLRPLGSDEGLPDLPETRVLLLKARQPRQPATDLLAAHLAAAFGAVQFREDSI